MNALVDKRLDDLVFARIAGATGKTRPPPSEIIRSLASVAPPGYDAAQWSQAVRASIARLVAAGALDHKRNVLRGTVTERLNTSGKPTWRQIREKIVPAFALGIAGDDSAARERLKDVDRWVAAILARATQRWRAGLPPTLAALGDAMVAKASGKAKRASGAARIKAFKEALGVKDVKGDTFELQAASLAAGVIDADDGELPSLRNALVWRWMTEQRWGEVAVVVKPEAALPPDFAQSVGAAAARATAGLVGSRKVLISALWRDPLFAGMPLDEFKRQLIKEHKAGTVALMRADRSVGLDPVMVRDSETLHLDSRYHLVERKEAP